jgi:hypothetical protein
MNLEQADLLAQLSSNEPRKQVAALLHLKRACAVNPAQLVPLAPFLLQRFIVPREETTARVASSTQVSNAVTLQPTNSTAAAAKSLSEGSGPPHLVQKRLVYTMLRCVPLTGPSWVTFANCMDRDVQAAWRAAIAASDGRDTQVNFSTIELGVTVLRTVASFPWTHLQDYLKPRWDTITAILSKCPVVALQVSSLLCITALVRGGVMAGCAEDDWMREEGTLRGDLPASVTDGSSFRDALAADGASPTAEAGHRMAFVLRILHRNRFGEILRRLLVSPSAETCVEAWRLVSVMVMPHDLSLHGVRPVPPLPGWFCAALGLDDEGRRECVNRCMALPATYSQAILLPLTAMCLSSRHSAPRLFLTICDKLLFPRLHSSWCSANLAATATALL